VQRTSLEFAALVRAQDGLFRYQQALAAGMSAAAIRRRADRSWQHVVGKVYAGFTGELSERQRYRAGLLHGGPDALLSHCSALRVRGVVAGTTDKRVHITVPITRNPRSEGFVVVHRTRRPPAPRSITGLPVTRVDRAVVETAVALSSANDVRALVAEVLRSQLTDRNNLVAAAVAAQIPGVTVLAKVLRDMDGSAWSAPEAELLELLVRGGLPRPLVNQPVVVGGRTVIPDLRWGRVVVELDSQRWHASPADWAATLERHNLLTEAGYVVLHVSPRQLRDDPSGVVATIQAALRQHGGPAPEEPAQAARSAPSS
jgi:hypothetical protein